MKLFKKFSLYRRVGPKLYKVDRRTDRQKLDDDWHKVNADMWRAFKKYQRAADNDEKKNDQFRLF